MYFFAGIKDEDKTVTERSKVSAISFFSDGNGERELARLLSNLLEVLVAAARRADL